MNAGVNVPDNAVPTMHFSTDMFPLRERAAAWREFFGRGIVKLEIEPLTDGEFPAPAPPLVCYPISASLPAPRTARSVSTGHGT